MFLRALGRVAFSFLFLDYLALFIARRCLTYCVRLPHLAKEKPYTDIIFGFLTIQGPYPV